MFTALMILLAIVGASAFLENPPLGVVLFILAMWVGGKSTAEDETRLISWIFFLALLGIVLGAVVHD